MKQPKVQLPVPPPPAPTVEAGPRYRYFSKPPETVTLLAGDFLTAIPESARAKGFAAERHIDLPAREILSGPSPKIALDRLAELAPECFRATGQDVLVSLPAGKVALAYNLVQEREELPPEEPPFSPLPLDDLHETYAPPVTIPEEEAPIPEAIVEPDSVLEPAPEPVPRLVPRPAPASAPGPLSAQAAKLKITQRLTPVRVGDEKPSVPTASQPLPAPQPPVPPPASVSAPFRSPAMLPKTPAPITPAPAADEPPLPPPAESSVAKRPFSVLPLFRRKQGEMPPPPPPQAITTPTVLPRRRVELPPPRILANRPPEDDELPAPEEPEIIAAESEPPAPGPVFEETPEAAPEPPPAPVEEIPEAAPEPPVAHFAPVEEEPVYESPVAEPEPEPEVVEEAAEPLPPPPEPKPTAPTVVWEHAPLQKSESLELPNHDDLQALFLTEETLNVERIVELCGSLPGVNSSVLSHGAAVIAAHNVPDSIDLVSLSAHALEMIGAMRASSAKMGVGAIPAVTLHSEKGPITFFHRDDLCLLILHKDRGFVPGVREKLQRVVDELVKARLPRPVSSSPRTIESE